MMRVFGLKNTVLLHPFLKMMDGMLTCCQVFPCSNRVKRVTVSLHILVPPGFKKSITLNFIDNIFFQMFLIERVHGKILHRLVHFEGKRTIFWHRLAFVVSQHGLNFY
jgi:hypothetical protein